MVQSRGWIFTQSDILAVRIRQLTAVGLSPPRLAALSGRYRGLHPQMVRSALSRIVYYRIGSRIKIPESSLPLLVQGPWRKSPTYSSWVNMKSRCLNPNHFAFSRYGGRGITICARWLGEKRLRQLPRGYGAASVRQES